jgi:hypothetical protein
MVSPFTKLVKAYQQNPKDKPYRTWLVFSFDWKTVGFISSSVIGGHTHQS